MAANARPVRLKRRGLLLPPAPDPKATVGGCLHILGAEVFDGLSVACLLLRLRWITAASDLIEKPLGLFARRIGSPRRSVLADGVPPLAALACPVHQDKRDEVL